MAVARASAPGAARHPLVKLRTSTAPPATAVTIAAPSVTDGDTLKNSGRAR